MPDDIKIIEVGPRDGLQNEPNIIPTDIKIQFINQLSRAGYKEIESGSFVSPKWVPQLADADEVFRSITRQNNITYSALVPNIKGLERARKAGVTKIAIFTAASETFNNKNINAGIKESLDRFKPVIEEAINAHIDIRAYVSTAFWCPYEGKINPEDVMRVIQSLLDLGINDISIGDTIGKASPPEVRKLLQLLLKSIPAEKFAMHFHDTYGMAIANALTSLEEFGIRTFDSSAGGLGGCPYAKGASGNVATEDLVFALESCGVKTGINLNELAKALKIISPSIKGAFTSKISKLIL